MCVKKVIIFCHISDDDVNPLNIYMYIYYGNAKQNTETLSDSWRFTLVNNLYKFHYIFGEK